MTFLIKLFWFLIPTLGLFMADATPTGGSGDGNPDTPPPGDGDNTPAGDNGQDTAITFNSQAELDAMFKPRMAQAAKQAEAKMLETLGVENVDALSKAIKDAEAAKQAQMTELEKAQAEIATAKEKAATAEAEAATVKAAAEKALLKAAVISAAGTFQDPNDAWLYVDQSKITVNEETGEYEGIEDAIKAVAEAKAYLLKQEDTNPNRGTPPRKQTSVQRTWQQTQQPPQNTPPVPTIKF